MRFRFHLIVLLMSILAQLALAQTNAPTYTIKGSVLDPSGAVIPGAQVSVITSDGKPIAHGRTDNAGIFSFNAVPVGTYVIDVTKQGFREVKQQTKMGLGTQTQIRIVMPVAAVAEEMTVAATADTAAQVSTEIALNQSANSLDRDALDRILFLIRTTSLLCLGFLTPIRLAQMG
jgi:hypothetical protein